MKKVSYIGIFFDEETQLKLINKQENKLPVIAPDMHCTFKYEPNRREVKEFFKVLGGIHIPLEIIGYASDEQNSGFLIKLTPEQQQVYTNDIVIDGIQEVRPAHITVSMAEDAHAVNTGYLNFKELETPFVINGKAGVLMKDKDKNKEWVEYENPYKIFEHDER